MNYVKKNHAIFAANDTEGKKRWNVIFVLPITAK